MASMNSTIIVEHEIRQLTRVVCMATDCRFNSDTNCNLKTIALSGDRSCKDYQPLDKSVTYWHNGKKYEIPQK